MMKKFLVLGILAASASCVSARDDRHLRFASTPTEAAQPGADKNIRERGQAPYALTGRRAHVDNRPASTNLQNWVVDSPHFRPGK